LAGPLLPSLCLSLSFPKPYARPKQAKALFETTEALLPSAWFDGNGSWAELTSRISATSRCFSHCAVYFLCKAMAEMVSGTCLALATNAAAGHTQPRSMATKNEKSIYCTSGTCHMRACLAEKSYLLDLCCFFMCLSSYSRPSCPAVCRIAWR
jgi:hypothetical protein